MKKRFVNVTTPDDMVMVISHDVVALAVPALDDKDQQILGTYALLPTKDLVKEPLDDLAAKFGLAVMEQVAGPRIAIAPGAVLKVVPTDRSMIGCSLVIIGIPGLKPAVVKHSPSAVGEILRKVVNSEDDESGDASTPGPLVELS